MAWAASEQMPLVGIDNLPGAVPIESVELPMPLRAACSVRRDRGSRAEVRDAVGVVCSISQYGSTRSINAGVASGIAMHTWIRQHAGEPPT